MNLQRISNCLEKNIRKLARQKIGNICMLNVKKIVTRKRRGFKIRESKRLNRQNIILKQKEENARQQRRSKSDS